MPTFDAGQITLEQVREHVWELPQTGDMRVPARVLASEALLEEIAEDKTLQQLQNTTHLPGIQKYAVCMPDGHQGYGFPVGGVAAIDAEEGCISPGAVGYDINCLSGKTDVLLSFGRRRPIADLSRDFEGQRAVVAESMLGTADVRMFTETGNQPVYEVATETGDTVVATADHPFYTPNGMVELEELEAGETVYVHPFKGIDDEQPDEFVVLDKDAFADEDPQLVRALVERDLLPLKSTDEAFNVFLKLVGFHTGDGAFSESSRQTWFYGDPEDLDSIREDIRRIGFKPSRIDERDRQHEIDGAEFDRTEYSTRSGAEAFMKVLQKLGAPTGKKVESRFGLPWYFDRLASWQQALYLSAFFGAEMSAPAALAEKTLSCPTISHNRVRQEADAGEAFLRGIAEALENLGIDTTAIERFNAASGTDGERIRLRLGLNADSENLIRFFSTIGYRYNRDKRRRAMQAIQYLKNKEAAIDRRADIAREAVPMADGGAPARQVKRAFDETHERSLWSGRQGRPRPPEDFPGFDEFCEQTEIKENLLIESTIRSIEPAGTETVYDIGVDHGAHNFLANGFVVSNCGVRMVRTNLDYDSLRGHEEELVESLFANIPTGLGGGGVFEGSVADVEAILDRGMDWALEHDFAVPDDLEHCEDEGSRPEADPSVVSQKAKERGSSQVGSLGSGNHFLEVQRVTDIFRDDVAADFGLQADQIVVLIHTGSRGLGHQVCTDYLRDIEQTHAGLLAQLPDKELAAAPAGSQLADEYYRAMCAAINFAWVNRQLITHRTRRVFERVFDRDWETMDMHLLYDVAHNIAKREVHDVGVGGTTDEREVFVHRKGATRAFPAGRPEVPAAYRDVGQPILIPGSMGAGSYVLRGGQHSLSETFGSTAHGAGRLMSRTQAKQEYWGEDVMDELRDQDRIYVKAQSGATVAEEAPGVYKDVDEVVRVSDALGIGDKVARTFPVCNIKG